MSRKSKWDGSTVAIILVPIVLVIGQGIKYLVPKVWDSFPSFVQIIWGDVGGFILLIATALVGLAGLG